MIPHVFHQIWVGPQMPSLFAQFSLGWQEFHPDWELVLWDESTIPVLENQRIYDTAEQRCPSCMGQLRSDIARYEILFKHGGVYLDVDFECLKPIDPLLEGIDCFTAWEIQDQYANNAIFGAVPGHPFLRALIDGLEDSLAAHPDSGPWKVSGPRYMTSVLEQYDGPPVTIFPESWLYPIRCRDISKLGTRRLYKDAYAVHWWNHTHQKRGKVL